MSWRDTYRQKIPGPLVLVDDLTTPDDETDATRESVRRWFRAADLSQVRIVAPDDVQ